MLNQATLTADIIKQLSVNAVNATQPFAFMYGTVTSVDPIEIEIDQKLKLGEKQLIFSTLVQDFDVDMYMEHEVEETDLIHKHDASIVITSPHGDTGTITVQNSPDSDKHIHEYKGVKTFTLNLKLAKDEKVLLLRIQGGQKFLVLDRVRVLNDTEFSSEFEGEGSTGSSGGSSSGSSSGSSGSGNSGTGGGSTDNVNPDSGVISVTALMTALLALTPEQKQELGLTGVKIDDENKSSESTYSSEKIESLIPDNTELEDKINAINELLPEQAKSENQLADKDFVNSSISTNTAYFIGTFNSLSELQASNKTITKNDYAFIIETDEHGNSKYNRYKWNGTQWLFEYALNNSSFTSNQWKTINSNITEESISAINNNIDTKLNKDLSNLDNATPIAKGGTGATTAKEAQYNLLKDMNETVGSVNDNTSVVLAYTTPATTSGSVTKRKLSYIWDYIQGKISSVLGLTASTYKGTALKATHDANGDTIDTTYARKTDTLYKTSIIFYGTRNGRYLKIGSIPISSGSVAFANLTLSIFCQSPNSSYPVGTVNICFSSGSNANGFNINGFSTISLSDNTNNYHPKIVVEKTSTHYVLYVDCSYTYLGVVVKELDTRTYTRANFEESSSLTGTIVFNSTTNSQIKYLS